MTLSDLDKIEKKYVLYHDPGRVGKCQYFLTWPEKGGWAGVEADTVEEAIKQMEQQTH